MYRYAYVGPEELRAAVLPAAEGQRIGSRADFERWVSSRDLAEPFTFVVGVDGVLRLAPRRSEHVACAGGGEVLSAGEIGFGRSGDGWYVREVTNQSTGYCPDADSWPAVAAALEQAELAAPAGFTAALVFRWCPRCGELNVVRDGDFTCVMCEGELPLR
jgi:hypothetical protein